ncbi:hypothetical protein NDU88_002033 [Pleurodeles waltl]|uniref:Uncharacterized protein n=1 Tax=Pleurodeles waltl TaxID=8319 RepID=A0AAV7P8T9_PLEWA|nr:hypothetical protein NDU88_002033 [Pleurodeles waltl]
MAREPHKQPKEIFSPYSGGPHCGNQGIPGANIAKIDSMALEVALLHVDLMTVMEWVTNTEGQVSELQLEVNTHKKNVTELQSLVTTLNCWVEDVEGRSRRNNLRFVGIPERAEGQSTKLFSEE